MNNSSHIPHRPTVLEVSVGALEANFRALKRHSTAAKFMAVLKANAYGHGLVQCAKYFETWGADYLGVAYVEEGVELRRAGITMPIQVLGGVFAGQIPFFLEYDLDLTASSVAKLEAIEEAAKAVKKRARVHLKIDTGMERIGVHYYSADALLEKSLQCKQVDVVGVFSHLAKAGEASQQLSKLQLERFLEVLRFYDKRSLPTPLRHLASSGAVLALPAAHLDMVRPGLALYGVYPSEHVRGFLQLRPVATLKSQVVYFKVVRAGAAVSYEHLWTATEDTRVVTVPVGYGDGYTTRFSNNAEVLIAGKRCPVIGRVCMDQLMVNLGPSGTAYNGDEVVLLGEQGKERIRAEELGMQAGTSAYEVLTSINQRVPRVYV